MAATILSQKHKANNPPFPKNKTTSPNFQKKTPKTYENLTKV